MPGSGTGANETKFIVSPKPALVVSSKNWVPDGAGPEEEKRLKSPEPGEPGVVPHGAPEVGCPTNCMLKSRVPPFVFQLTPEKSERVKVPFPTDAPVILRVILWNQEGTVLALL